MIRFGVVAALVALLLIAAQVDARTHRIPNSLVVSGLMFATILHTALPPGDGFLAADFGALGISGALLGALIGFVAFLPFHLMRGFAAGDVKLMAMIGSFLGPADTVGAILATVLAGGLQILATLAYRHIPTCERVFDGCSGKSERTPTHSPQQTRIPYGVAIATGTILFIIFRASQTTTL